MDESSTQAIGKTQVLCAYVILREREIDGVLGVVYLGDMFLYGMIVT